MDSNHKSIIGLITDFGLKGMHYVAAMKAVIIEVNPKVRIIDIHHHISPFSIIETSFIIKSVYNLYPQKTIFVVVVDPGVGTSRPILALKTNSNHYFIGPDNGIFWLAFAENGIKKCVYVQNEEFYHKPVSNTFHGRDIMAPVAAYLSKDLSLNKIGPEIDPKNLTPCPITYNISLKDNTINCIIQYIDNFGNLVTNIPVIDDMVKDTEFKLKQKSMVTLKIHQDEYKGIFQSRYGENKSNHFLLIKGSSGYLEISMNQKSAAKRLKLKTGDSIQIKF